MTSCQTNYCDWVSCDDEGDILIATGMDDVAEITTIISNKDRSEVGTLAIVNGYLTIPRGTGPLGWFNPYAGTFTVTFAGCYDSFCGYNSVTFEVRNGTGKNIIECHCAVQ